MLIKKLIFKYKKILFLLSFILLSIFAVYLFKFNKVTSPFVKNVDFNKSGVLMNDTFEIKHDCAYFFELWLNHETEKMNEFSYLIEDKKLAVNFSLDVYLHINKTKKSIYHTEDAPKVLWRSPKRTGFNMGFISLNKGIYSIKMTSPQVNENLATTSVQLTIAPHPNSSCHYALISNLGF